MPPADFESSGPEKQRVQARDRVLVRGAFAAERPQPLP